jgi:hypothetical protein
MNLRGKKSMTRGGCVTKNNAFVVSNYTCLDYCARECFGNGKTWNSSLTQGKRNSPNQNEQNDDEKLVLSSGIKQKADDSIPNGHCDNWEYDSPALSNVAMSMKINSNSTRHDMASSQLKATPNSTPIFSIRQLKECNFAAITVEPYTNGCLSSNNIGDLLSTKALPSISSNSPYVALDYPLKSKLSEAQTASTDREPGKQHLEVNQAIGQNNPCVPHTPVKARNGGDQSIKGTNHVYSNIKRTSLIKFKAISEDSSTPVTCAASRSRGFKHSRSLEDYVSSALRVTSPRTCVMDSSKVSFIHEDFYNGMYI